MNAAIEIGGRPPMRQAIRITIADPTAADLQAIAAPRLNPTPAAERNGGHFLNAAPEAMKAARLVRKTEMVSAPTVLS